MISPRIDHHQNPPKCPSTPRRRQGRILIGHNEIRQGFACLNRLIKIAPHGSGLAMKLAYLVFAPCVGLLLPTWLVNIVDAQSNGYFQLIFERSQSSGIDGRDWDKSFPGAMTVDAVHRSTLLRFPLTAEKIKEQLDAGLAIEKVEVVLDYDGVEIAPEGYIIRNHLGEQKWKENPPQWHLVAWALRRPWIAEKELAPTFNGYLNGAGFWTKYGAGDSDEDRFPTQFGPSELSQAVSEGRLDITPLLNDPAFGPDIGVRLRPIEENGLLLKKLETYDVRYRDVSDPYEWAVPTGGHGLRFKNPRLVVTFRRAAKLKSIPGSRVELPKPVDLVALAESLRRSGAGGSRVGPGNCRVGPGNCTPSLSQIRT
jgi:hypothetical protein